MPTLGQQADGCSAEPAQRLKAPGGLAAGLRAAIGQQAQQLARGVRQRRAVDGDAGGCRGALGIPQEGDQAVYPTGRRRRYPAPTSGRQQLQRGHQPENRNAASAGDPVTGQGQDTAWIRAAHVPDWRDVGIGGRFQPDVVEATGIASILLARARGLSSGWDPN